MGKITLVFQKDYSYTLMKGARTMRKNVVSIIILILLVVALGTNGYLFLKVQYLEKELTASSTTDGTRVIGTVHDVSSDTTEVVANVSDSIVTIEVYANGQAYSTGSGVVYQKENKTLYIVTNHHVISGGDTINVLFANGESVTARLLGSDEYTDLAVLESEVDFEVEPIAIGDSNLLDVGETVIAIGSPLGSNYSGTTTQGIVSGLDRVVSVDLNDDGVDDWDMNVIQTDAAINPGNSGGALINMSGELVGITSMKISNGAEGIGFAIPISDAMKNIEQLKENGKITRPVLGIQGIAMESISSYARYYNHIDSSSTDGVYVYSVQSGSAAWKAGMESGDIMIRFDEQDITTYKSFLNLLYAHNPGDMVVITVERDGHEVDLSIVLE